MLHTGALLIVHVILINVILKLGACTMDICIHEACYMWHEYSIQGLAFLQISILPSFMF